MISDQQARESKWGRRAIKTWSNLMDAQRASDSKTATKVAMDMDRIMLGAGLPEEREDVEAPPMSEARKQLHEAFPDLKTNG